MVSATTVALGSVSFVVFMVMAVLPSVPFLPVGRTTGTLLSAAMMVIFRVLTPEEAFAVIDLSVLALLFGMMLVCAFLERAGFLKVSAYHIEIRFSSTFWMDLTIPVKMMGRHQRHAVLALKLLLNSFLVCERIEFVNIIHSYYV